jgi:hypothetical protein
VSGPWLGGRLRSSKGEFLKVGRQGDANRLKELTSDARGRGSQQEALAILLKLDFLQTAWYLDNPTVTLLSGNLTN